MLTGHYVYDLKGGILLFLGLIALLCLVASIGHSLSLNRILNMQDKLDSTQPSPCNASYIVQIVSVVRRFLLFVIGYKGRDREIFPPEKVNFHWMEQFCASIIWRFIAFYFIYIQILLVLTRPVGFNGGEIFLYNYAEKPINLASYLVTYVVSNALFDYLSIKYTLKHLDSISNYSDVVRYGAIDLLYAIVFFIFNQAISCVLWYLKRREQNVVLSWDVIAEFIDITLWPYSFVSNIKTGERFGALFPGQLLITGTVFLPTLVIWGMIILYTTQTYVVEVIKKIVRKETTQKFCRKYLTQSGVSVSELESHTSISFCNVVAMLIFNSIVASTIFELLKAMASAFLV
jgi:hypothetical protein